MCSGSEAGSYSRRMDICITRLESNKEETEKIRVYREHRRDDSDVWRVRSSFEVVPSLKGHESPLLPASLLLSYSQA